MKWIRSQCRQRPEVSLLAAGALNEREQAELKIHFTACAECRSYYAELKSLTAPMTGWEKAFSTIEATQPRQRRWAAAVRESEKTRSSLWHELFWPNRYTWTGMAALWLAMLIINRQLSDSRTRGAAMQTASSQDIRLALEQSHRVMTELAQPGFGVSIPPPPAPRPRSQRKENGTVI